MAVGEVSAVREVQAEDGVARLNDRRVGRHVGRRAGVRLHVGVLGAEELLGAIARQVLDHVGELASAVIALAGIALGVLVGEDRAGGFKHGLANEVLGGDQLQPFMLAALLVFDSLRNVRISFRQRTLHRIGGHDSVLGLGISLLVHVVRKYFHVPLRLAQRHETEFAVERMCVAGSQVPAAQSLQIRMAHDALHHPRAQPSALVRVQHVNVAQIGESRVVTDDTREPDLPVALEQAEAQRIAYGALH